MHHQKKNSGPANRMLSLDQDWLFGGKLDPAALQAGFNDTGFSRITLPHCVAPRVSENVSRPRAERPGKLLISFSASINYASLSALEVAEE
jgi:hypothetical protein